MATLKQTRAAINERVNTHWLTAFPAVKLYFDNAYPSDAEVDKLSAYVLCSIEFTGGAQMDISAAPNHRVHGRVVFTAACREGDGSSKVLDYLDSLVGVMKFAQFSGVVTQAPVPGAPYTADGWFSYDLSVRFFTNSIG